jgi:hypothetical protein
MKHKEVRVVARARSGTNFFAGCTAKPVDRGIDARMIHATVRRGSGDCRLSEVSNQTPQYSQDQT